MAPKKNPDQTEPNIALCYIRQSRTQDEEDTNSPERQRANIQMVCDKFGWTPEWYSDTEGHKSGRHVKNRPEWLALNARIGDPDVVALIANDLARLHRKGWRVGDLIEHLEQNDVRLVLAAPGREVDTSTPQGRMFVQFTAMLDEYYAEDISQRAKDSVAYRKKQGKTIGQPPYGTMRDTAGFLTASNAGIWLLPDGKFVEGTSENEPPHEGATWRGYYEGAGRILEIYAEGESGYENVAYQVNEEGFLFRTRKGKPRPINADDVRRVVANWDKYGGIRTEKRSKERSAFDIEDPDKITFNRKRAVYPIGLLREVARVRKSRARVSPTDDGKNQISSFYALSAITYCAHCERLAHEQKNPKLRSTLTGTNMAGYRKYRHKTGISCGTEVRSVPCEDYEQDFIELLKSLTIKPEMIEAMAERAIEADLELAKGDVDLEQRKQEAIDLCQRRINAAITLYGDGHIDYDDYHRRIESNEREMTHWESFTTEEQKLLMEFTMAVEMVNRVVNLWEMSDDENRQGLVRDLFSYIVYDLETRRILDFRLKPWADQFVTVRGALYQDEQKDAQTDQQFKRPMPHTGFEPVFQP